ncbi:hypothetical protein MBM_06641 [Drepanopeziza brunnea f. sp. 'multigermtubi' MB_m1]|uniref:Zn(2)-C6 fungal-type domain-containing protein n=1 Tax=Marssonina brunnea f. sp. multigermtubi (strain MB_m1) TaxID=1072389 RepID=K1WDD6_MARBU|nr:uncharacterized protein MBM_06641 [Drepanopeziza brunnea f. sp. 'multigermtubi' MB_m1]EKD15425.1 hypothetical protein MBM_06641 [Drepanopeziza brunnea f. sp. 'multigermtubi' MB_m1]
MSNFRKIRPSFGENSPSTGNPSQSTSESTGSDPRRPRGDKDTPDASSSSSSKRRRVPESVTRNACLNCKKARAKCDGKKPCKRCATRVETSECIYEVHIKHAKEELVKQIKELRAKDHMTEQILQALSTDEKVPEILDRLKRGETYDSIVEWLGRSPMGEFETLSPRDSHLSLLDASDHEMTGVPANNWTTVTSNTAILDHLFQLYFAWVHPVHTLFSEPRFVESYQRWLDNFCSPVLVNAICAMACHLHTAADGDEVDYEQLGVEFSDAVRATLDPSDCRLTSIQAFAVMYLVDCARGHALRAVSYLKTATEYLPAVAFQDTDGFGDSWKDTVRGIRNLNIEWAQMTFQAPPIIDLAAYDGVEANDANQDIAKWYIYRYAKQQPEAWPSLLATTNREKSKLNAILQDIALMIYTRRDIHISAKQFLHQYERLKKWREGLPDEIGNIEGQDRPVLPHVLYLLRAVAQAITGLQGISVITGGGDHMDMRPRRFDVTRQLTDVIARFFPGGAAGGSKDGAEAVQFGMELLVESRVGFPIAGPLQEMLRRSANECAILLPRNLTELMQSPKPPQQVYRIDDFLGACGRSTYVQPNFETHQRYSPSFSSEWSSLGHIYGFRESTTGARRLRVPSAEERAPNISLAGRPFRST